MTDRRALEGCCAVVAGGSRGIGRAVAVRFAREGAAVVIAGRTPEPVDEVVEEVRALGGRALGRVGSVADFDFARELVETCTGELGRIDVLVNCAGVAEPEGSSILDLTAEAWNELVSSHLTGTFHTCRHAAPHMVEQGSGAMVNTSSHAYQGIYGGTGYPAAKGGVNSLTYALAAELREHGIRVNAVCPGARTRLSSGAAYEQKIRDLHARGILDDGLLAASLSPPEPEDAAAIYAFLASDLARGVTGRIFSASGGYVGLHGPPGESGVAFRDTGKEGRWSVEALAERIRKAIPGS